MKEFVASRSRSVTFNIARATQTCPPLRELRRAGVARLSIILTPSNINLPVAYEFGMSRRFSVIDL